MQLGLIGLGRMGGNMAKRLLRNGHQVVGWNQAPEPVTALVADGGIGAASAAASSSRLPISSKSDPCLTPASAMI